MRPSDSPAAAVCSAVTVTWLARFIGGRGHETSNDHGALAPAATAAAAHTPGTTVVLSHGSGLSKYPYRVYTPKGWTPTSHMPLYVMVHGCQTTAEQQERANLLDPLADAKGFVVVYPDTNAIENAQPGPTARCWQFPSPLNWLRGHGDVAAVAAITQEVIADWGIDRQRVYVMGMSAGSFLSADLAATYPDLYAASGENAGGAYADGTCLVQSVVALPAPLSATLARSAMGRRARVVPRIVIGGDADQGIPPACADKALEQSLRTNNLVLSGKQTAPISLTPASVAAGQVPHGRRYTGSAPSLSARGRWRRSRRWRCGRRRPSPSRVRGGEC